METLIKDLNFIITSNKFKNKDVQIEKLITDFLKVDRTKELALTDVVKSLPTEEEVSIKGVSGATSLTGWDAKHKLSDKDEDTYYTGWMDCYEWMCDYK